MVSDGIASFPCPGSCGARVACCDSLVGDVGDIEFGSPGYLHSVFGMTMVMVVGLV